MRSAEHPPDDAPHGLAGFVGTWDELLEQAPFPAVVVALADGAVHLANAAARSAYGLPVTFEGLVPSPELRRSLRQTALAEGIWEGEVALGHRFVAVPVYGDAHDPDTADALYLEAAWSPVALAASAVVTRLRAADREIRDLRTSARFAEVRAAVTLAAARGDTFGEVATLALTQLERVLPVRDARVTLLEDETLRVVAGRRHGETDATDARTLLTATPAGLARAHRAPEQVVVSASSDLYPALRPLEARGLRSVLYAPLVASGAVLGFVELRATVREVFLAEEVTLAADLAHVVATALVRERMTEQAARHAQSLERRAAVGREELDRTQEQLLQAAKLSSIGELAAGLVHELNQPLNVLGGYVELLRDGTLGPYAQTRALDVMAKSVERMSSMVDNLRNFARVGGQDFDAVDLSEVIFMARELTVGALARGLETECPPGFVVRGDANRLEQVFVNLFANALQSGGDPVTVALCALEGDRVAVDVRDRGPGVPEPLRARIFEPFFTTKPRGQGTGLGLSVSARIVAEHGGTIEIHDNPGGGAWFRVVLPRAAP